MNPVRQPNPPLSLPVPEADSTPLMNAEMEASLLGALLLGADYARVAHLTDKAFGSDRHKRVFAAITRLVEKAIPVDLVTVKGELGTVTEEGHTFLLSLMKQAGANPAAYGTVLEGLEARRLMEANLTEALKINRDRKASLETVIQETSRLLADVLLKSTSLIGPRSYTLGELSEAYFENYAQHDFTGVGLDTGYPLLNAAINGFDKGRVYLIGAGSGVGKSIFGQCVARNRTHQGGDALIVSTELIEDEFMQRGLSAEAQIDMNRMKTGQLSTDELARLGEVARRMNSDTRGQLHVVYMRLPTLEALKAKITQLCMTYPIDLVVIDYVAARMFTPTKRAHENPVQFVGDMTVMFRGLAKDLNIILMPLSQLSAEALKRGGEPALTDFANTVALAHDADIAAILKDETPYTVSMGYGETRLHIVKSRTGGEGQFVPFEAQKKYFRFDAWRGS